MKLTTLSFIAILAATSTLANETSYNVEISAAAAIDTAELASLNQLLAEVRSIVLSDK